MKIPNSGYAAPFKGKPWFIYGNAICCLTNLGVRVQLFEVMPHQHEIVDIHNANLLAGITDDEYNLLVEETINEIFKI